MPGKGPKGGGGGSIGHGRPASPGQSESSPGHLKEAAGARSARDFAPGRLGAAPDDNADRDLDRDGSDEAPRRSILDRLFNRP
jgi:hypothetical protein